MDSTVTVDVSYFSNNLDTRWAYSSNRSDIYDVLRWKNEERQGVRRRKRRTQGEEREEIPLTEEPSERYAVPELGYMEPAPMYTSPRIGFRTK